MDETSLSARLRTCPEEWWYRDKIRQEKNGVARNTTVIRLNSDHEMMERLNVQEVIDQALLYLPPGGTLGKQILSRVPPNCEIEPHIDMEPDQANLQRIHVPLLTNALSFFITLKPYERINLKCGQVYVVDTNLPHMVLNLGTSDRTHLVFDYYRSKDGPS